MILIKGPVTDLLFLLLSCVTFIQFWVYWVTYRRLFYKEEKEMLVLSLFWSSFARRMKWTICGKPGGCIEQAYSEYEVIVVNDCSWMKLLNTSKRWQAVTLISKLWPSKSRKNTVMEKNSHWHWSEGSKVWTLLLTDAGLYSCIQKLAGSHANSIQ